MTDGSSGEIGGKRDTGATVHTRREALGLLGAVGFSLVTGATAVDALA